MIGLQGIMFYNEHCMNLKFIQKHYLSNAPLRKAMFKRDYLFSVYSGYNKERAGYLEDIALMPLSRLQNYSY